MQTRITERTRIPTKAASDASLQITVYVQNVSDYSVGLMLKGKIYAGGQVIKDINFDSYENVPAGSSCPFTDILKMPKQDVTLILTSYYWRLRPKQEGDVREYGDWLEGDVREYDISVILPPPLPPDFTNISLTFSK